MNEKNTTPELSEVERVKVAAFGFDKPEHDHDGENGEGCTCGCPVSDCLPCGGGSDE